jgi:hypothetical protein
LSNWVKLMKDDQLGVPAAPGQKPPEPFDARELLSGDQLHPSRVGVVVLCAHLARALEPWVGAGAFPGLERDVEQTIDWFRRPRRKGR